MQKVFNALSVLAFLIAGTLAGGTYLGYKYVTSPQFEVKIKNKLMGDINKVMPEAIQKQLPSTTGKAVPF